MQVSFQHVVGELMADGCLFLPFQLTSGKVFEEASLHQNGLFLQLFGENGCTNHDPCHCQGESGGDVEQMGDGNGHQDNAKDNTQNNERDQRTAVVFVVVPPFITSDDKIVVRTEDATYVERAK